MNEPVLNDRQQRILRRVARGEEWRTAAKAEGCSTSYAKVVKTRMMKNPAVVRELEAIRSEARAIANYDLVRAMDEALDVIAFAKEKGSAMAYLGAVQHRAKLSGLLIDKVQVVTVDLTKALAMAEQRVLTLPDACMQHAQAPPLPLPSKTSIRWGAVIAGDRVAEEPAAGPADDESVRQVKNGGHEHR